MSQRGEEMKEQTVYEIVMANQAEWTEVEGTEVLRVKDSNYVAVPVNGRKNSRQFVVIDLNDRTEDVCYLLKSEVHGWLHKAYAYANNLYSAV